MAMESSFSPRIVIYQSTPFRKPVFGMAIMPRKTQLPVIKKAAALQIKSSIRDQVFEDESKGIICYKDERGEIICEGFDEGPRIHPHHPPTTYPLKDAKIVELLQQRWLQIVDGETANNSSTLLEEHSCNGFKKLH